MLLSVITWENTANSVILALSMPEWQCRRLKGKFMTQMLDDIEYLSEEIGARPAGTEEEQQAALYITEQFQKDTGFPVTMEDFVTSSNVFNVRAVCSAVVVLCALFAIVTPVPALVWALVAVAANVIYNLETWGKPIITDRLARGASQNVIAKYQPNPETAGQRRVRKVVLIARYDTGKEKSALVERVESMDLPWGRICVIGMAAAALLLIIRIGFTGAGGAGLIVLNVLTILAMLIAALPAAKAIAEGLKKGFNVGANNNASGVAALLEVARRISRGSVSEADLAKRNRDVSIHGEEAARRAHLVPEGARIVYESSQLKPPYHEPSDEARLASAKAALAAFTGVPGARWEPTDIADKLVQAGWAAKGEPVEPDHLEAGSTLATNDAPDRGHEGIEAAPEAAVEEAIDEKPATEGADQPTKPVSMRSVLPSVGIEASSSYAVTEKIEPVRTVGAESTDEETADKTVKIEPVGNDALNGGEEDAVTEPEASEEKPEPASDLEAVSEPEPEPEEEPEPEKPKNMWAQFAAENPLPVRTIAPAATPVVRPVAAAIQTAPEPEDTTPEHGFTGNLPDWFVAAQQKANRTDGPTETVKRSKYAVAFEAAELAREEQERLAREQHEQEARELIAPQVRLEHAPEAEEDEVQFPVGTSDAEEAATGEPARQAHAEIAEPAPSRSGMFRRLRADIPSLEGDDLSDGDEPAYSQVSTVGKDKIDHSMDDAFKALDQAEWIEEDILEDEEGLGGFDSDDAGDREEKASDNNGYALTRDELDAALSGDEEHAKRSRPSFTSRKRSGSSSKRGSRKSHRAHGGGFSEPVRSKGLLGLFKHKDKEEELSDSPQEWLDVDDDFEARAVGRERGSWESFRQDAHDSHAGNDYDDYDDYNDYDERSDESQSDTGNSSSSGRSWYGGASSRVRLGYVDMRSSDNSDVLPPILETPEEAQLTGEIERIYHFRNPNFTTEIWFVCLGAEVGLHDGAAAFLAAHRADLRGAMVVEVESLGAGTLSTIDEEGQFKPVKASRRLNRYIDKTAESLNVTIPRIKTPNAESAAAALSRGGCPSLHLAGMDGVRPSMMGDRDDVIENIDEDLLQDNVDFLMELVRRY